MATLQTMGGVGAGGAVGGAGGAGGKGEVKVAGSRAGPNTITVVVVAYQATQTGC